MTGSTSTMTIYINTVTGHGIIPGGIVHATAAGGRRGPGTEPMKAWCVIQRRMSLVGGQLSTAAIG